MRYILIFASVLSAGCGITFGVDAKEESFQAEHSAEGIGLVRASDLAVREQVLVLGGNEKISASLDTTRWASSTSSASRVRLDFEERASELLLVVRGATEATTVESLTLGIANGIDLAIDVTSGLLEVEGLDGALDLRSASGMLVENCSGPIRATAPSISIIADDPVDLEASKVIGATLRAGGFMTGTSMTIMLEAVEGDLLASTQGAGNGGIQLFIPRNTPLTLVLRAKQQIRIDIEGYSFDSTDPERGDDGLDIISGITVDIAGGGPHIDLAAETLITVLEHES